MKVLKHLKRVEHNQLIDEVYKQTDVFKPQPQQIKEAIEKLINQEYMKRDPEQASIYLYQS